MSRSCRLTPSRLGPRAFPPSPHGGSAWSCRDRARPTHCRRSPTACAGLPCCARPTTFEVSEFALRTGGRVHRAEAKAGFGVVADYFAVPTDPRVDLGSVDPITVVDLTDHVRDGVLHWDAPPGDWTVLRLGASLTGQTNGPAPADATGLEVDKLDGERVRAYLDTHLRRFGVGDGDGDEPSMAEPRFAALLSDSIEAGPQNWTEAILDHFEHRRGYDAWPWLPALAGYLVGAPEDSDRFLYDYRRTITELLADEYYGTLATEAHRRGMGYYAEALEDGRPQLGDDLAMRSHADVPMGAMWTFDAESGPLPTYVADLKGASSVAHVHGKPWVGAEAFTSFDRPWASTPRTLKHVADLQLALGVTRFCIHASPHQPIAAPPPGIALAPFLGQAFTVNETWSGLARPWIDYLARCSALLSMGTPAVDVAVFVGEEAPVTGLFEHQFDTTVPAGFDFDYVGPDARDRRPSRRGRRRHRRRRDVSPALPRRVERADDAVDPPGDRTAPRPRSDDRRLPSGGLAVARRRSARIRRRVRPDLDRAAHAGARPRHRGSRRPLSPTSTSDRRSRSKARRCGRSRD